MEGGGQPVLSFEQCFVLFCSFPLLFVFVVGGLGFEFCVFVAGWRHALRSERPFIIIIIVIIYASGDLGPCFGLALGCVFTPVVVIASGPCTFPGHLSSSASACLVCVRVSGRGPVGSLGSWVYARLG